MSDRPFALPGAQPHYAPDKIVDVLHIDLHLRPDFSTKTLHGVCTQTVAAIDSGVATLHLDAVDLEIVAVTLGPQPLDYRSTSRTLSIDFPQSLVAGEPVSFAIEYRAVEPRRGAYFIDEPRQLWTQGQDQDARAWFPCFDHPAEKQTTSATIVVERGLFALSNGELTGRTDSGATTEFRYEQRIPHATYLVTLVVGEYAEIRQRHERFPVWYFVERGREADAERAFARTPAMIECFERTIGVAYPFERYGQIAVADFIFGGMENTAATTQTDRTLHDERAHIDFSSDPLVSHELAHQWFGDLITCRDWSQAWLNEGFATYFECVWREAELGWDEYLYDVYTLVQDYLEEDRDRYRRPIVCNVFRDPIELFDRHLYQKSGAVLHMLRGELGWDRMQRSLQRYVRDNAQRTVETIDLVRAIEGTTGRNLRGWFAQWIERAGHPEISVGFRWDAPSKTAFLTIDQQQTVDDAQPAYDFTIDAGFIAEAPSHVATDAGDGALPHEHRVQLHVQRRHESFAIPLETEPRLVRFDPGAYLVCTLTYAFDADLNVTILRAEPSPVGRIRAAKALGVDGSRIGREALAVALERDPCWGVAAQVATVLGDLHSPFGWRTLVAARGHEHPKVRRAIAEALGSYRQPEIADALLELRADASYFVAAAAYESLGKTRDPRALAVLTAALATTSWNQTVESGAARGLAELADARAFPPLLAALRSERGDGLRRAAVRAIARLGSLLDDVRTAAVDALLTALDDPRYLVRVSTYVACETLADARLLPALDRLALGESDGRLRRDAAEAARRIREAQGPHDASGFQAELDRLRAETRALRERVDVLAGP